MNQNNFNVLPSFLVECGRKPRINKLKPPKSKPKKLGFFLPNLIQQEK